LRHQDVESFANILRCNSSDQIVDYLPGNVNHNDWARRVRAIDPRSGLRSQIVLRIAVKTLPVLPSEKLTAWLPVLLRSWLKLADRLEPLNSLLKLLRPWRVV